MTVAHGQEIPGTNFSVRVERSGHELVEQVAGQWRRLCDESGDEEVFYRPEWAQAYLLCFEPKADVVITNPTHFAVALEYDTGRMKAPTVVAKGQDLIALRIRQVAEEHKVPVVENPPLARALFDSADLGEEIPTAHYEAVAKIISYVYQLKGKLMPGARRV